MKKRIGVAAGISILLLTAIVASSQPSLSRPDLQTRLRDFGVPAGAELIAAGQTGDGKLFFVEYRDGSGEIHAKNTAPRPTPRPKTDR